MGDLVTFWIVAPVSVGSAALMVVQRNAVHAALLLILNQFTLAVFFVLLGAELLAVVQVVVYAGAIMVLFLFVIMFLGVDRRISLRERLRGQRAASLAFGALLLAALIFVVQAGVGLGRTRLPEIPQPEGNVQAVARVLFTDFVFPFEVTSVLLLVAAIAAVLLARRPGPAEAEKPGEGEAEAERQEEPVG